MKKDTLTELKEKKIERQVATEKELGCKFIRTNHNEKDYDEHKKFNERNNQISKSNKKSANSLIEDLSKRLLELEFKKWLNKIKILKVYC